jgi:hypothetical protein
MENKKELITPSTPEAIIINRIAEYLLKHGKFNSIKVCNMVVQAFENNTVSEIDDADKEIAQQCIENIRTMAIWEKWGE